MGLGPLGLVEIGIILLPALAVMIIFLIVHRIGKKRRAQAVANRPYPISQPVQQLRQPVQQQQGLAAGGGNYDVFISYRRNAGSESARLIRGELRRFNLRVFLDVDDLRPGHFDQELLHHIATSPNFVVILSPNCLQGLNDRSDWFGREISEAIRMRRNIIPIIMPGFHFPEPGTLPPDIRPLLLHQSVSYSHEFFDAMVGKIRRYIQ